MTNRLNKQRVYLAGAIDRVADRGIGWRDMITPFLINMGVVVFNPIKKPTDIGLEDADVQNRLQYLKQELHSARLEAQNYVNGIGFKEIIDHFNNKRSQFLNKYVKMFDTNIY